MPTYSSFNVLGSSVESSEITDATIAVADMATGTGIAQVKVGTYTGDGNATQAITGVGFQPEFMMLRERPAVNNQAYGGDVTAGMITASVSYMHRETESSTKVHTMFSEANCITAFGADGFTAGGATTFNVNAVTYDYIAFNAL